MRKFLGLVTMIVAVGLMPVAFGQTQTGAQATPEAQAEPQVIPADDKPSKEQMDGFMTSCNCASRWRP